MFTRKSMVFLLTRNVKIPKDATARSIETMNVKNAPKTSKRIKEFHTKLKTEFPNMKNDRGLCLVDIDPKSGEFIPDSEKEPIKWGDWQHGGRVSDF